MNQNQRNGAPVLARNCEIGCASFISGDIPRNRSPPGFLRFSFSKFQEIGGNDMLCKETNDPSYDPHYHKTSLPQSKTRQLSGLPMKSSKSPSHGSGMPNSSNVSSRMSWSSSSLARSICRVKPSSFST